MISINVDDAALDAVAGGAKFGCSSSISSGQYQALASGWNNVAGFGGLMMATGVGGGFGLGIAAGGLIMSSYNTYCSV